MDRLILNIEKRPALEIIFSDVTKGDHATLFTSKYQFPGGFYKFLYRVHHAKKLNKIITLPGKHKWERFCPLLNMEFNTEDEYYVVFLEASAIRYTVRELESLDKYPNVHMCLLLFNPLNDLLKKLPEVKNLYANFKFERYYAIFDEDDIQKRGYYRVNAIYSKQDIGSTSLKHSDFFFVGLAKDRQDYLQAIYTKLNSEGFSGDFSIVKASDNRIKGIQYLEDFMDYEDYLKHLSQTDCIVEIVQRNQNGMTLRTFEAIVYGKKLITNNPHVLKNPFYNKRYMKYFHNIEDLDVSFLHDRIDVDYGYKGEFSPINLLEQIKKAYTV